jgi:MOSC domain-containing protein YiiM
MVKGKILSVNIGKQKGKKKSVHACFFIENFGIQEDFHAGCAVRQVSLLARESIDKIRQKGLNVGYGDFAENLTTDGIDLISLAIGTKLRVGKEVIFKVSQIGKVCPNRCYIYYSVGDCVMPREGIFAEVLTGGEIKTGDDIMVL